MPASEFRYNLKYLKHFVDDALRNHKSISVHLNQQNLQKAIVLKICSQMQIVRLLPRSLFVPNNREILHT